MKPVHFPEENVIFAEDQPEHMPLPAYKSEDGQVISCWAFTWRERFRVLWNGRVWLGALTFHTPHHPVWLEAERPFVEHP